MGICVNHIDHFKSEEDLLFSRLSKDNNLRIQSESDHENIYQMVSASQKNPEGKELLKVFDETLEKHIRFEEGQLFNYLQANIPESALLKIPYSLNRACVPGF